MHQENNSMPSNKRAREEPEKAKPGVPGLDGDDHAKRTKVSPHQVCSTSTNARSPNTGISQRFEANGTRGTAVPTASPVAKVRSVHAFSGYINAPSTQATAAILPTPVDLPSHKRDEHQHLVQEIINPLTRPPGGSQNDVGLDEMMYKMCVDMHAAEGQSSTKEQREAYMRQRPAGWHVPTWKRHEMEKLARQEQSGMWGVGKEVPDRVWATWIRSPNAAETATTETFRPPVSAIEYPETLLGMTDRSHIDMRPLSMEVQESFQARDPTTPGHPLGVPECSSPMLSNPAGGPMYIHAFSAGQPQYGQCIALQQQHYAQPLYSGNLQYAQRCLQTHLSPAPHSYMQMHPPECLPSSSAGAQGIHHMQSGGTEHWRHIKYLDYIQHLREKDSAQYYTRNAGYYRHSILGPTEVVNTHSPTHGQYQGELNTYVDNGQHQGTNVQVGSAQYPGKPNTAAGKAKPGPVPGTAQEALANMRRAKVQEAPTQICLQTAAIQAVKTLEKKKQDGNRKSAPGIQRGRDGPAW